MKRVILILLPVLFVLAAFFGPVGNYIQEKIHPIQEIHTAVLTEPKIIMTDAIREEQRADTGNYIYIEDIPLIDPVQEYIQDMCEKYELPYALMLGLMETESSFDYKADSGMAYGLCQIGYINFETLQEQGIDPETTWGNIEAGCYMMSDLLERYGDLHRALMAYNLGESWAEEEWDAGKNWSTYSVEVLTNANKWNNYISELKHEKR